MRFLNLSILTYRILLSGPFELSHLQSQLTNLGNPSPGISFWWAKICSEAWTFMTAISIFFLWPYQICCPTWQDFWSLYHNYTLGNLISINFYKLFIPNWMIMPLYPSIKLPRSPPVYGASFLNFRGIRPVIWLVDGKFEFYFEFSTSFRSVSSKSRCCWLITPCKEPRTIKFRPES